MRRKQNQKLGLAVERIRVLSGRSLSHVVGGGTVYTYCGEGDDPASWCGDSGIKTCKTASNGNDPSGAA